jgi:hypothetical protein
MKVKRFYLLLVMILFLLFSSCNHHCEIRCVQNDVNVRINKRQAGFTPLVFKGLVSNNTPVFISLSKPGYEKLDTFIIKDGHINKFTRILGFVLIFPLHYDQEFKKSYTFNLIEKKKDTLITSNKVLISESNSHSKSQRLIALKEAFQNKVISKEEYIRMKKLIIEGDN